jgi:thimet oligopeptidase
MPNVAAGTNNQPQVFCPNGTNPDLPKFETSAAELQQTYDTVIGAANQKLEAIAALASVNPKRLFFENTILAFENVIDAVTLAYNRAAVLKDVHPDPDVLDKATELYDSYTAWFNAAYNNGGVYKVLRAYANKNPKLAPDAKKLMDDTLGIFKRNGLTDDGGVNPDVLRLLNEIADLQTQVNQTVLTANAQKNYFTAEELEGLTADQLAALPKEGDNYVVLSGNRGVLRDVVMGYANKEATRWKAKFISNARALDNIGLITTIAQKRLELAKILGFNNWADYKTQPNMAKNGATASGFVNTVSDLLHPKLDKEITALSKYIQVGVNDDNGQINAWDVYYFKRFYEKDLAVDYGALIKYFPYDHVLRGMFDVYEKVFRIKIEFVPNPVTWYKDVQLVKISERWGNWPGPTLGYVYFDNFPRIELGKFAHAESAGIIYGKDLSHGRYRKPVSAVICNFPVNADGTPADMLYTDIDTLFHEFGHSLHIVLGKARFASQNGFGTPLDFVEVPSTMLEQWRFDPGVFKMLAISDPALTDEFIQKTITAMKTADLATKGLYYERQFGFGRSDFAMHTFSDASQIPAPDSPNNLTAIANQEMAAAYLGYPQGSGFLNSFLHIWAWGYDAGYYAYAWSDSIVAELAVVFEDPNNHLGYLNPWLGMKYRIEVLQPGASRDVTTSVEAFTGKPLDPERKAFLKRLGI